MDMEDIYRALANKNGVSVSEVKREMQNAINEAYKNPTPEALAVPRRGAVPTVDEFLEYSFKEIAAHHHH